MRRMGRARIALAGTAIALTITVAGAAPGVTAAGGSSTASLTQFLPIAHGVRRGVLLAGTVPGVGRTAIYEPVAVRGAIDRRDVRVVYIVSANAAPAALARGIGLASTGDQLVWDATIPPFVAVLAHATSASALERLQSWVQAALPSTEATSGSVVMQSSAIEHTSLADDLTAALQTPSAREATAEAARVIPPRFTQILSGPDGGTVWQGRIPGAAVPRLRRASLVYLPPNVDPSRRYPLVIMLHGLRGSPYSVAGGLRLPEVVDPPITTHQLPPFIAVIPPAGLTASFDGEWTGPWERYVVQDVMPWADAHLPVERDAAGRVIAGFSAGGYGAVDIALRHPSLFGVAESWSGYFDAPHDGSLKGAPRAELAAHSPTDLVEQRRDELLSDGTRFWLSAGRHERVVLHATRRFGGELDRLGLSSRVLVTDGGHDGRQWHAVLRPGLTYALSAGLAGR
jgi:enterochelin esterase-like enzyme